MRRYFRLFPFTVLFLLAGCQTQDGPYLPNTQPDVRGNITNIKKTNSKKKEGVAVVLIESIEGVYTKHDKATLRIDAKTHIETTDGAPLRLDNLREGQTVEVWFDGQVMESYPVQAHATAIRIGN